MKIQLLIGLSFVCGSMAFVQTSPAKGPALRTASRSVKMQMMWGAPFSRGGLPIGGGFGTYDPYLPYVIEGREFGDYYDPYSAITQGYGGDGGPLGYGVSIEEVRGDVFGGRPFFAYDEYQLENRPFGGWYGGGWW